MTAHLLLIDASGFAHRAYHAGNPSYRSDGLPTWATIGFLGLLWRLLGHAAADPPSHAAAVFDAGGKTHRHDLFPEYKSNRPARDAELLAQFPWMHHACRTMGVSPVSKRGFEADDVIATLAYRASREGARVSVVSSDKDFCQLVRDDEVEIIDPVAHIRIREADVRGVKFGVEPRQVPDVQALAGDDVDNIPGIDGIGLKSAAGLVRAFGSIEGVISGVASKPSHFTPSQRVHLKREGAYERLALYRLLATLLTNVDGLAPWQDMPLLPIVREHIEPFLDKLEAKHRFESIFRTDPVLDRVVPALDGKDPLDWWKYAVGKPSKGFTVADTPQCGFFKVRLVKGGPWVGARIWREAQREPVLGALTGNDILRCEIGETLADPLHHWESMIRNPIQESDYRYLIETARWAREHAPDEPEANPMAPIDWNKVAL